MDAEITTSSLIRKTPAGQYEYKIVIEFGVISPLELISPIPFDDMESCKKDCAEKMKTMTDEIKRLLDLPVPELQKEYRENSSHLN